MAIAQMTATAREVVIGGETYTIHPLTLGDYGAFEEWMRTKIISAAKDACSAPRGNTMSKADVILLNQQLNRDAINVAASFAFSSTRARPMMMSVAGQLELVRLSLSKGQPLITSQEIAEKLKNNLDDLAELLMEVLVLSGLWERPTGEMAEEVQEREEAKNL